MTTDSRCTRCAAIPNSTIELEARVRNRTSACLGARTTAVDELTERLLADGNLLEQNRDAALGYAFRYGNQQVLALDQDTARHLCRAAANAYLAVSRPDEDAQPHPLANPNVVQAMAMDSYERCDEFIDSAELAYRLVRAEEYLGALESLLAPALNDRKERERLTACLENMRHFISSLWNGAPLAGTKRRPDRAMWQNALKDAVAGAFERYAQPKHPFSATARNALVVRLMTALGIDDAPDPDSLRRAEYSKKR